MYLWQQLPYRAGSPDLSQYQDHQKGIVPLDSVNKKITIVESLILSLKVIRIVPPPKKVISFNLCYYQILQENQP